MNKQMILLDNPYVFVAIEFGSELNGGDTRVLGVYTTREIAEAKVTKEMNRSPHSYFLYDYAVLKKPIQGRTRKVLGAYV